MECPKCGAYVPQNSPVCVACGSPVSEKDQKPTDIVLTINGMNIPCQLLKVQSSCFSREFGRDIQGKVIGNGVMYKRLFTLLEL